MVAVGSYHACALTTAGGVKCWGVNFSGELGDNTTIDSHLPVDVSGLSGGVTFIAVGSDHSCAVTAVGGVKCWGLNYDGQLGDGTTTDSHVPVDVSGLTSDVVAVAASRFNTCALTTAGGVTCWGYNYHGRLGNNSTISSHVPVDVMGLTTGAAAIAVGDEHSCALTTAGGVKCWGYNMFGQLGNNTTVDSHIPVDVSSLGSGVAAIAAGFSHNCALTTAGGVKCWGSNSSGQLGDNTAGTDRHIPVDVSGLSSGVAAITAGANYTCALTTAGGAKCWGNDDAGQLGDSNSLASSWRLPVDVLGLTSGVAGISAGYDNTCAVTATGRFKCWGMNDYGQLGDNTTVNRRTPVDVAGIAVDGATIPDAPKISTVTPGNVQATVRFTPPANNGGVPITAYTVTASPGGMSATRQASPVTITGLTNGTSYVFTVAASNAMGTGAPSAVSAAVTPGAPVVNFLTGWNLVGNSVEAPLTVATTFNDASTITSIWKWVTNGTTPGLSYPAWAFYSPTQTDGGRAYAASKGYDFLTTINAGEGFWLNARAAFSASLRDGATAVISSNFKPAAPASTGGTDPLPHGWSLIATGDSPTPSQFDAALVTVLSAPLGTGSAAVYTNLNALWAWDATNQAWYYWAPSLVNNGGLAAYLAVRGYRDFATMPATPTGTLSPTTGFWVNVP